MFSKSCEYAIKACIYIVQNASDTAFVSVKEIAKGISAPERFTAKILQNLSRKKLINSTKGLNGGFAMTEEQSKIKISELVLLMDGTDLFERCVLGLESCSDINPCPMHHEYKIVRESINKILENNTIQDFKTISESEKFVLRR